MRPIGLWHDLSQGGARRVASLPTGREHLLDAGKSPLAQVC